MIRKHRGVTTRPANGSSVNAGDGTKTRRKSGSREQGIVSVVIPVLNEAETIASVVGFALGSPLVKEVIVVDDGSIDGTPELARVAGAKVFTSKMLGKGGSMEDGMQAASCDLVLYMDGDLRGLCDDLVAKMVAPLRDGTADFVKARFTRNAGRVTVLTARPLLRTYFPELAEFNQPLSGVMAARKPVLEKLHFENDYGVDIGLFIDAFAAGARLSEIDIGHLEHDSHSLDVLGDMATQVARTILDRAGKLGRLRRTFVMNVKEMERAQRAELGASFDRIQPSEKIALFDMDGVLLNGRFIRELAERAGRMENLKPLLDNFTLSPEQRARKIAGIFAGVPQSLFVQTAKEIPLTPGAIDTVVGLRKIGYRVGIVTDSYMVAAEVVRRRVFADFSFAHLMRFKNGRALGRVTLSPAMAHDDGCCEHLFCKVNVLRHLRERLGIAAENVVAVGDGENDLCLLRAVGQSFAFEPKVPQLREAANHVVEGTLSAVLTLLQLPETGTRWLKRQFIDRIAGTLVLPAPEELERCSAVESLNR